MFLYFCIAVFLAFYLPGNLLLGKIKDFKTSFEKIILYLAVGMMLWVYQGLIFGYLHARFLTYGYLFICFIIWFSIYRKDIRLKKIAPPKHILDYLLIGIFIFGICGQLLQFFITGFTFSGSVYSIMAGADDSLWHTSVISELVRRFPPNQPGYAGMLLHNYHYLTNLVIAELVRVFHLPVLATQFQYTYLFVSFLFGGLAYVLAKTLNFTKIGILLFVYLQYFSSDVIYILTLFTRRVFEFSVGPLEDGTTLFQNPPRAFSYIMIFAGCIFLTHFLRKKSFYTGIISALFFGFLIGFKVHSGLGILGGLVILGCYFLLKKQFKVLLPLILTGIISIAIHVPVNKVAGIPIYAPFEMSRMFAVQPKLDLSHFELARRIYGSHHNIFGEWRFDLIMLAIFLFSQFGIRNLGWIPLRGFIQKTGVPFFIFLYGSIIVLFILGTFFYQPIGGADIFNFYLALALLLSVPTAYNLSLLFESKTFLIKVLILLLILFTTIPRWIQKTSDSITAFSHIKGPLLEKKELEAFEFIDRNTPKDSVILVSNYGQWDSMHPYVGAFSKRDTFLSGQGILYGHGISYDERKKVVEKIFSSHDSKEVKKLLTENNINLIYFYGDPALSQGLADLSLKKIFQNQTVTVYKL